MRWKLKQFYYASVFHFFLLCTVDNISYFLTVFKTHWRTGAVKIASWNLYLHYTNSEIPQINQERSTWLQMFYRKSESLTHVYDMPRVCFPHQQKNIPVSVDRSFQLSAKFLCCQGEILQQLYLLYIGI